MKRKFERGLDEIAEIDINPKFSFVSIGKENVENQVGFAVRTFQVQNAMSCLSLLCMKSGTGWRPVLEDSYGKSVLGRRENSRYCLCFKH